MKKVFLLLTVLLLSTGSAFAQKWWVRHSVEYKTGNDRHEWSIYRKSSCVSYRGEVNLGYSIGVGDVGLGRVNIHTIQGVQVGRFVSAGLGAGIDIYHYDGASFLIPIYLNVKGYLPVSRIVTPYLSLDIGGGIGVGPQMAGLDGVICAPAVGVQVSLAHIQVGYALQQFSNLSGFSLNCHAVQLKVGVHF